jgi:hypothetical protein
MKSKDISLAIVLSVISALSSYFLSSKILIKPVEKVQKVQVYQSIKSEFSPPDYFDDKSINITKNVKIGDEQDNVDPFKGR